MHYFNVTNF